MDRLPRNAGALEQGNTALLTNRGVFDAAKLAAEYLGKWNSKRQWFENISLSDAMVELGLAGEIMHRAAADAKATLDVLRQIADGYESLD